MTSSALPLPSDRTFRVITMTLLALAALAPASAMASGQDVIEDCIAGHLKSSYAAADLRDALADLPTDVAEYTDCASQIQAMRNRSLTPGTGRPYVSGSKVTAMPAAGDTGGAAANGSEAQRSTPEPATTPTTPQTGPISEPASDDAMLALPVAGPSDGGSGGGGGGFPTIPAVLAFSVIMLGLVRAFSWWSSRPEAVDSAAEPAAEGA